jgi:glycosyl transferase, family 25
MRIPVFLINLDRSPERLRYMQAQAEKCGMVFERVAAVDGFNVPHELADYFAHYRTGEEPLLAPGDFGCYASHIKVWQTVLRSGSPVALVLEDDAAFDDDLVTAIEEALAVLPAGWDMVHLSRRPDRAVKPLAILPCGRMLVRYSRVPSGTAGYLVSSSGAAKMLNPLIARVWPVDTDTRRPWVFDIDAYGLVGPPLRQEVVASTIKAMGGKRRYRAGLPLPSRYCWTGQTLRSFRSVKFNLRKLGLRWWLRCLVINCAIKMRAALRPVSRAAGLVARPEERTDGGSRMNPHLHSNAVWLRAQYNDGGIDGAIEAAAKQTVQLQEEIEQLREQLKKRPTDGFVMPLH